MDFQPKLSPEISSSLLGIVGPTGIGKTEAALSLTRQIPSEIVVVDSMQVYRGMDIGTGKPDRSVRDIIPHHGLDLVEPEEEFNVARYVEMVSPEISSMSARGHLPVLVGGSGLYLRALIDGLCPAPGEDPVLREKLLVESREKGAQQLHDRLKEVDPPAAAKIHPNNLRRLIRALEVFLTTGRPLSQWHRQTTSSLGSGRKILLVGLTCDRALLYRRIEQRIDGWLEAGWLDEAKRLRARSLSETAREALGYRELFDFLDGRADWQTTCQLMKRNTCRYAKRQLTWFRADPRIHWIQTDEKSPEQITQEIRTLWNEPSLSPSN